MAKATLSRPGLSGVAAALVTLCITLAAAAPGALATGGDAQPPASSLVGSADAVLGDAAAPVVVAPAPRAAAIAPTAAGGDSPSLAEVCHTFAINGSRDFFNACRKRSDRTPAALVEACDEVAKEPAAAAGDALASAFTALAEGRADTAPARDVDAACALATVYRAHTAACDAPEDLAAACDASRARLLHNASAALGKAKGDAALASAPTSLTASAPTNLSAVACRLAGEGFGLGGGGVYSALSKAPKSLQSRACELNKGFGFRPALSECQRLYDGCEKSKDLQDAFAAGRDHVSDDAIIISDDGSFRVVSNGRAFDGAALPAGGAPSSNDADATLGNGFHTGSSGSFSGSVLPASAPSSNDAAVNGSHIGSSRSFSGATFAAGASSSADATHGNDFHIGRALNQQDSDREEADAIDAAGGALAAAFAGLERGDMSGATPEAVATACTLARSQSLLRSACRNSDPCSSDWVYENTCLDIFRKGESKLPRTVEVNITDTMTKIWKDNHPGESAIKREFVHTDCCDKISSTCRCDMRKRIIKESGKAPTVACLNTKELQSCKP